MGTITRVVRGLVVVSRWLSAMTLLFGVAVNFSNIIGRYFLDAPIDWAEEVMLFLMVGMVFFGAVAVSWDGRHIKMDILVEWLPPGPQRIIRLLVNMSEIVVAIIIVWLAIPVILQLAAFDERSQAANIPLDIPQSIIPLSFVLIAIVALTRILQHRSRTAASPPDDKIAGGTGGKGVPS